MQGPISGIQKKFSVGDGDDPLEKEADRVAEQVLTAPAQSEVMTAPPQIQRFSQQASKGASAAPASVDKALSGSGTALESALQEDMSQRFDHDFSNVRVHTDTAAAQSARDVNADAYTAGNNIVFAAGRYAPQSREGQRLIAHELTHVVQQGQTSARTIRRAPPKGGGKTAKPKVPMVCGRRSRKVAGNSITKVILDVGANTLKIEWADPKKIPPGSAGTHAISPGAGLCCVDCNVDTVSQTQDTLCTPKGKGTPWKVTGNTDCHLPGFPTAKNPTYFQRKGIAIHSGNTSSPPQSHGCARTSIEISELIHDNSVVGTTEIESNGTWKTNGRCYMSPSAKKTVARKDVCDGNKLKPKDDKKGKGKGKGKSSGGGAPVAPPKAADPKPADPQKPATPPKAPPVKPPVDPNRPVADNSPDSDEAPASANNSADNAAADNNATADNAAAGNAADNATAANEGDAAAADAEGADAEGTGDGPGPNNAPPSHEEIGYLDDEEVDSGENASAAADPESAEPAAETA
jgi:hypothetical protein